MCPVSLYYTILLFLETSTPKFVGWEKNEKQKLGPRMVNLSASMDPAKYALPTTPHLP